MRHEVRIGTGHFDIEHFRPRVAGGTDDYENLYWSCKECNSNKSEHWPTDAEHSNGRRYADPCREQDYGHHLLERADGTLVVVTGCGRYHLGKLLLNRPDLVEQRHQRTELRTLISEIKQVLRKRRRSGDSAGSLAPFARSIREHERQLHIAIPYIPGPKPRAARSRGAR